MQIISPFGLATFPHLLKVFSSGRFTLILMNFSWSNIHDLASATIKIPKLLSIPFLIFSIIISKGKPQICTQKGEWIKVMLFAIIPLSHLLSKRRLFSIFHGPLVSTHRSWNLLANLNWKISFPTSTIFKSWPIFQTTLSVFLKARRFYFLFVKSFPIKFREHSFITCALSSFEIKI